MRCVRCAVVPAGIVFALAGCSAVRPVPVSVEQKDWTTPAGQGTEYLTDHFDLHVLASDSMLREVLPAFMEASYTEYARLVPPARPVADRLPVYLFQTRSQWAAFTQQFVPAQAYTYLHIQSGGYTDYPTATSVTYDIRRDLTLSLLAHEGMHQYLARYFPEPVPPWLNEGLACQFEAFDLNGDRPTFTPRRNFLRRNNLRDALSPDGSFIPLPELLRMNAGDAVMQSGSPTRLYYAQVWSLILFLRESHYAPQFKTLLADAGTDRLRLAINGYRVATPAAASASDGEIAFRHYITSNLDELMLEYREFARSLVN